MENDFNNPFVNWVLSGDGQVKEAEMVKEAKEIGRLDCKGNYKVCLYSNEAGHCIPHVHIVKPGQEKDHNAGYQYAPAEKRFLHGTPDKAVRDAVEKFFSDQKKVQEVLDYYTYKTRR